jgi:hypothetical protein
MKSENNTENTSGSDFQERLVRPWVDVTSFSQNAKDRTPRTWRARFGKFDLVLIRHIGYAPDQWTAYCDGVFPQRAMASMDVREAACQAKAMLQAELETAISEILGASDQSDPRRKEDHE